MLNNKLPRTEPQSTKSSELHNKPKENPPPQITENTNTTDQYINEPVHLYTEHNIPTQQIPREIPRENPKPAVFI